MKPDQSPRNPWKFFALIYAYSWTIWLPSVLAGLGVKLPFDAAGSPFGPSPLASGLDDGRMETALALYPSALGLGVERWVI